MFFNCLSTLSSAAPILISQFFPLSYWFYMYVFSLYSNNSAALILCTQYLPVAVHFNFICMFLILFLLSLFCGFEWLYVLIYVLNYSFSTLPPPVFSHSHVFFFFERLFALLFVSIWFMFMEYIDMYLGYMYTKSYCPLYVSMF